MMPSNSTLPNQIRICEVGPRDGLQNEPTQVSTEQKLLMITRAIDAGVRRLEVSSFVHPTRVPQMADAEAVFRGLKPRSDVTYIGLVLNKEGYLRALATSADEIGTVVCATDTFAKKNQGQQSWQQSTEVAADIIRTATREGRAAQATISVACGCPFEGEVDPDRVVRIAKRIAEAGAVDIAIADTIGVGVPSRVGDLFFAVSAAVAPVPLRAHFHNTRNTGIANAWAAVQAGAKTIDASIAGLGGCPFAPRATGNIGTEDLVYLLERSGIDTGLDLGKLIDMAGWVEKLVGKPPDALVSKAGQFPN
jgi:hydroxymethylglutaryl-CoA lyase